MIHVFPSNRLETLAGVLAELLAMPSDNPLSADAVMVQHPGMQHWLSMQLAAHPQRGIAMNLQFPLPVRHLWALIRQILGEDATPQQTGYEREILAWRLYRLLGSTAVCDESAFVEPTRYWQGQSPSQQALRRFQLAEELADLYEQYLMYRPDWIEAWDHGELAIGEIPQEDGQHWQARLWRLLAAEQPQHPIALLREAEQRLRGAKLPLPERLFIFGINTLAPLWLDFLRALSEHQHTQVFILYLNPTDEYWEDARSEREAARERARWLANHENDADFIAEVGNPLLTGLGQQGQQFVRLLSSVAHYERAYFTPPGRASLLGQVQDDIYHFRDGREQATELVDDSLSVVSAHSALREVQGLHDWLLHRFNDDPTLTPKDVVVLCPNVEQYAPFVEAVFANRFESLADTVPPLPCSIADRNPGDADPTIAAFLELLTLPDTRFEVSQVLSWLQVPAIQRSFGIVDDDLERIRHWLDAASVHWGLDAAHKQQWIPDAGGSFSWRQGLQRLLLGFAWGDREAIVRDQLLLPQVEGAEALILGRLIDFITTLETLLQALQQERNVTEWQQFLNQALRIAVLGGDSDSEGAQEDLADVIRELGESVALAQFTDSMPLPVVRHVLERALATPAHTGRQFLSGQITVCSMVPMRTIPFRIVAILGLNDGEFPRQRPPLGFDRIAHDTPRAGDRSRRGDDRYLFLEALLSARDALYLSYQGSDVRTNTERQPSIVLADLLAYLEASSGWRPKQHLRKLPLQPFSAVNFQGARPAFDPRWLRLTSPLSTPQRLITLPLPEEIPTVLTITQLARALEHPARHFAQQRLRLYLDDKDEVVLEDSEPFTANHLDRYRIQQQLLDARLFGDIDAIEHALQRALLSGELPEHPVMHSELDDWLAQATEFAQEVSARAPVLATQTLSATVDGIHLSADAVVSNETSLLHYRLASVKAKDRLLLWLQHLLANTVQPYQSAGLFRGKDSFTEITLAPVSTAFATAQLENWLALWRDSLCRPLPVPAKVVIDGDKPQLDINWITKGIARCWQGEQFGKPASPDPYLNWFWPEPPAAEALIDDLTRYYAPLIDALQAEATSDE